MDRGKTRLAKISEFWIFLFLMVIWTINVDGGYFWHISDLHLDLNYAPPEEHCLKTLSNSDTALGEYGCDSPWVLADSALKAMKRIKSTSDVDFIIWTGDALKDTDKNVSFDKSIEIMKNATYLFRSYFNMFFVFPLIGHTDLPSQNRTLFLQLANMWKQWLPIEAVETMEIGGYYSIKQKYKQLRIVVLNSNLMMRAKDNYGQWEWLESILQMAESNDETIYLIAHIPPGFAELGINAAPKCALPDEQNSRFVNLIRKYSDIIVGQFYGHLHADTFRLFYDDRGSATTYAFIAPPVTPKDGNNPAIRLYHIHSDSGEILDYQQYYLDMRMQIEPEWTLEYELLSYYDLKEATPEELHLLKEKFIVANNYSLYFEKYYLAYNAKGMDPECDIHTTWRHMCSITFLERISYNNCISQTENKFKCPPSFKKRVPNKTSTADKLISILFYYLMFIIVLAHY